MADPQPLSKNLRRIRDARELSQGDVAERAKISRVAYGNIESGEASPRIDTLTRIAKALGVSIQDLLAPAPQLSAVRFRARKAMNSREQVLADVGRWLDDYTELEKLLRARIPFALGDIANHYKLASKGRAKESAAAVRKTLKIAEDAPIRDICGFLEEKCGVKVRSLSLASDLFFGLSIGPQGGGPAIAVNVWERISVERWIFTAVHELGHLLLHLSAFDVNRSEEDIDEEHEADQFASHFLMPHDVFRNEWNEAWGLSLVDRVLKVKRIFKVSYRTVLYRLSEHPSYGKDIWRMFQGAFKHQYGHTLGKADEPRGLDTTDYRMVEHHPPDEPKRLDEDDFVEDRLYDLVRRALEEKHVISESRAAEILRIDLRALRERRAAWVAKL